MNKIGITEAGDAGLDFSWADKLYDINIIITKHLTPKNTKLMSLLLENYDKIILHCTCTGYGGTIVEPNVPKPTEVYAGIKELISKGFPVSQIVLRTDPIIPTDKGIKCVTDVWKLFSDLGIKRCRFSIIDMYPHVKERFQEICGSVPLLKEKPQRKNKNVKRKKNSSKNRKKNIREIIMMNIFSVKLIPIRNLTKANFVSCVGSSMRLKLYMARIAVGCGL